MENECNRIIMQHKDINVHLMTKDEAMRVEEVKTRGLPGDVLDKIRIIEIQGISFVPKFFYLSFLKNL